MKRYHFIIDTAYDWSDTSSAELAFENAFIREEEYPDGTWVKWEDVEREMMPIPTIEIVETEGYDPREMFIVKLNGNPMGTYPDIEVADARVRELKRILNIP